MASSLQGRITGNDDCMIAFKGQSAGGYARQHVGNVYNTTSYVYTVRKRRSDESLRKDERNEVLLKAAREGQLPRVKYLIHHLGVEIDHTDDDELTALHHGVLSGFEDVVEVLLEAGIDVNSNSEPYGTPLHLAAINGLSGIFHLLLRYRANVKINHRFVGTVLNCACYFGDVEIARALLQLGCSVHEAATMFLRCLSRIGLRTDHSTELMEEQETWSCNALNVAVKREHVDLARKLIQNGADVNASHTTRRLMQYGDNPEYSREWTPLSAAAYSGNPDLCALLLDHGALKISGLEGDHAAPVITAVEAGNSACLKMLFDRGVPIGTTEPNVQDALFIAVSHEILECLKVLIERGVDVNWARVDGGKETPLHIAAFQGNYQSVRLLLNACANPKAQGSYTNTPLDYAQGQVQYASQAQRRQYQGILSLLQGD